MNELTYILGAGASYQSIPVVKTFPKRFGFFNEYVLQPSSRFNIELTDLYASGLNLVREFKTHQSFDTYFKKLFHNDKPEEIKKAKKILNLYFYWEHLSETDDSKPTTPIDNLPFWKQSKIDKRYDALIAGLLQPVNGELKMFCKTNFITWNYDLNLFSSLKNYFKPESTVKEFLDEITSDKKNENLWKIDDQIEVINMNGFFYSSQFDNYINLPECGFVPNTFPDQFNDEFCKNQLQSDSEKIKFAWEAGFDISKIAKSKINDSKNVVVIGYTFPLYNRLVDLDFISNEFLINVEMRKIILTIQDPNSVNIIQSLQELYENNYHLNKTIKAKSDCEQFYIPSNIYTPLLSSQY
jgi:hypothetical protein